MNRMLGTPQFRPDRLSLAEPGAEGGSGGGGPLQPQGGPTLPPLSQTVARQEMEKGLASSDPDSGEQGANPEGGKEPGKETPPVEVKPDSENPEKANTAPEGEEEGEKSADPETRINQAKARMHAATTKAAKLEKELTDLKAKVDLANKYVDWDKLSAYDKEQVEAELGRPLTKKDLEELKTITATTSPTEEPESSESPADGEVEKSEVDTFVEKFLLDNPHVLPYIETGEADGVVAKLSTKIDTDPEWAKKTPAQRLTELGKRVGDFFRNRDAEKEKAFAEKQTTRRTSLEHGGLPRAAGGAPPPAEGAQETDNPSEYIAERQARQARMFSVTR